MTPTVFYPAISRQQDSSKRGPPGSITTQTRSAINAHLAAARSPDAVLPREHHADRCPSTTDANVPQFPLECRPQDCTACKDNEQYVLNIAHISDIDTVLERRNTMFACRFW